MMTCTNVGETSVTITEKSPSQDFPRHDSQTTRSNYLPYFLCFIVSDISIWVFWWKSISQVHLTNCKLTFCHLISILHSWSVFLVPLVFFSGRSHLHYRKLNLNGRLLQTIKILRPLGELNEEKTWFSRPVTGLWLASDRSVKRWRKRSIPTTERDE